MAVLRANLIHWSGGGGKYKLSWRVETDDPWDGPLTIEAWMFAEMGIRKGVNYSLGNEEDLASFAGAPTIEPFTANRFNWTYSIDFSDQEPEQTDENPLNQPAEFSRGVQLREEVFDRDIHGKPIRNSAFDRYDELLTRDSHRTVLRVTKNYAQWPQANYKFVNTVNRTNIVISGEHYQPRQVRLIGMSDSEAFSKVLATDANPRGADSVVNLELCFAEDDWQTKMLDQGTRQSFRRWLVDHQQNSNIAANVQSIIRAQTREEAILVANANFRFGWDFMREIQPGYEPCRVQPPATPAATPGGAETTLPMMLDGKGRQQWAEGVQIYLAYQGYFETDFNRFSL